MKHTLNLHVLSFALASSLLISACTGNKQESTGNENEVHHMEEMKSDSSTQSVAVKVFENVDASVKTQLNGFLSDYFALNKALIEDNQETAKAAATDASRPIPAPMPSGVEHLKCAWSFNGGPSRFPLLCPRALSTRTRRRMLWTQRADSRSYALGR